MTVTIMALSQTILIIGTLKIPPEGPRASGCGDVGLEPAPHRSSSRFPFQFTLA